MLLRVQCRVFWVCFSVKGAFVTFGTLYRKIARVLLPVNFFSLTTGYILGVVVADQYFFFSENTYKNQPGKSKTILPYYNFIL